MTGRMQVDADTAARFMGPEPLTEQNLSAPLGGRQPREGSSSTLGSSGRWRHGVVPSGLNMRHGCRERILMRQLSCTLPAWHFPKEAAQLEPRLHGSNVFGW